MFRKKHFLPVGIISLAVIAVAVVVLAVAFGRQAGPLSKMIHFHKKPQE